MLLCSLRASAHLQTVLSTCFSYLSATISGLIRLSSMHERLPESPHLAVVFPPRLCIKINSAGCRAKLSQQSSPQTKALRKKALN